MVFLILYFERQRRMAAIKQIITSKVEDKRHMIELARSFIGKECIVYTFNSQITGVVKEVSDGGLLLESNKTREIINLDFVVRIREYPKNKNGKKKSVVLD